MTVMGAAYPFNQPMGGDMKPLLTAIACISLLGACTKDEPVPVASETAVVVPAESPAVVATVPAVESTVVEPAPIITPEPVTGAVGASVAGATEGSGDGMYVVEKGDTLWSIAERNNISHGNLAEWNNIDDPRELHVGRQLRLTAP